MITKVFEIVCSEREIHRVKDVSEKVKENFLCFVMKQALEAQTEIQGPSLTLPSVVPSRAHRLFSLSFRFLISQTRNVNYIITSRSVCGEGPVFLFPVH